MYVGEELLGPFLGYTDVKSNYPIQVIDLRFRVDRINLKKSQTFGEYEGATIFYRFFLILIRHREIKLISDGKKITEVS